MDLIRIWTWVAKSIFYDDNRYFSSVSFQKRMYPSFDTLYLHNI